MLRSAATAMLSGLLKLSFSADSPVALPCRPVPATMCAIPSRSTRQITRPLRYACAIGDQQLALRIHDQAHGNRGAAVWPVLPSPRYAGRSHGVRISCSAAMIGQCPEKRVPATTTTATTGRETTAIERARLGVFHIDENEPEMFGRRFATEMTRAIRDPPCRALPYSSLARSPSRAPHP